MNRYRLTKSRSCFLWPLLMVLAMGHGVSDLPQAFCGDASQTEPVTVSYRNTLQRFFAEDRVIERDEGSLTAIAIEPAVRRNGEPVRVACRIDTETGRAFSESTLDCQYAQSPEGIWYKQTLMASSNEHEMAFSQSNNTLRGAEKVSAGDKVVLQQATVSQFDKEFPWLDMIPFDHVRFRGPNEAAAGAVQDQAYRLGELEYLMEIGPNGFVSRISELRGGDRIREIHFGEFLECGPCLMPREIVRITFLPSGEVSTRAILQVVDCDAMEAEALGKLLEDPLPGAPLVESPVGSLATYPYFRR